MVILFSVLDMNSGYHQVGLEENHRRYTVFTVGPLCLFEYNKLPFGLLNVLVIYQRLMEECIDGIIDDGEKCCQIYLDDIIVASRSFAEHLRCLFDRFRQAQMKISPKKCNLFQDKVCYVGHTVSADGIEANQDKVDKIRNWPTPCDIIVGSSKIILKSHVLLMICSLAPTPNPRRREVESRKSNLYHGSGRKPNNFGKPFILHTDTSCQGLGAVLHQKTPTHLLRISWIVKVERNYPAHRLEFVALKWAVTTTFHDYLYANDFVVYTDNNPLTYVLTSTKLDATGHRWIAALSNYNFRIMYRSGKHADADGLSRIPVNKHHQEDDDFEELSPDVIKALCKQPHSRYLDIICMSAQVLDAVEMVNHTTSINWCSHQRNDDVIRLFLRGVTNKMKPDVPDCPNTAKTLRKQFNRLVVRRGVLYRCLTEDNDEKFELVLPKEFRSTDLQGAHNDVGHLGRDRGINILRKRFYWPRKNTELEEWIHNCDRCIKRKTPTNMRAPPLNITTSQPLELSSCPWTIYGRWFSGYFADYRPFHQVCCGCTDAEPKLPKQPPMLYSMDLLCTMGSRRDSI